MRVANESQCIEHAAPVPRTWALCFSWASRYAAGVLEPAPTIKVAQCSCIPHRITVIFVDKKGGEQPVSVPLGQSLLEAAHENGVELEGACEGSLACSTCHVIVEEQAMFDKLPEATDDENDMLDLAFGLTPT